MPHKPRAGIVLLIGAVAILLPILASIYLAWRESLSTEKSLSLTYAHDVLRRIEETANQFAVGKHRVLQAHFPPCSPQDIEIMRQVDLGSNYIQAAGRVSGDTLLCTSQGVINPVSLGKPSLITERGVAEYFHKSLSPQQWHPLNVFASGGFAIIVDPALAVDVPTEGPDVEFVVFVPSAPDRDRIATVGQNLSHDWFQAIPKGSETTYLEGGYLVTRVRSAKWDLSVIAATPEHYIY